MTQSPTQIPMDASSHIEDESDPSSFDPLSNEMRNINEPNPLARLQGTDHNSILIYSQKSIIGRDPQQCNVTLNSRSVSSKHAVLEYDTQLQKWYLTDLDSLNGTFVNHHRLTNERLLLKHGDSIRFGYDQISYVLYILTERDLKRPFEKPILNQKTVIKPNQAEKLQMESKNLKESILELKKQKKSNEIGTITFPGADRMITVPVGEWKEENRDDFPVHHNEDIELRAREAKEREEKEREEKEREEKEREAREAKEYEMRERELERLRAEHEQRLKEANIQDSFNQENSTEYIKNSLQNAEIVNLTDRISKLEKTIQDHNISPEIESFLETIYEKSLQILNISNDSPIVVEQNLDVHKLKMLICHNLDTLQDQMENYIKQLAANSKEMSDQESGIKRYATSVYNELQTTKSKLHALQMELFAKSDLNKRSTVELLTQQLKLKNAEIAHLRDQLSQRAASSYSDPKARKKIVDICTSQFAELEMARKEINEWRQRHRLRALEWEASLEERSRLESRVRELQHALHRQMSEVHVLMLHKEQHLLEYKSKVTELASGMNTQIGTVEQQINRKKAAEFLFDEITRAERENSNMQIKLKQLTQDLYQEQLKNNELKLEINSLKDVLQYTDAHNVQERLRALQDKLHDFQSECSVTKVLELKDDVIQLRQRLNISEKRCKKLQSVISKATIPIDDSCISFLERKIKSLEATLKNTKTQKVDILGTKIQNQNLQKQNRRLNELLYENSAKSVSLNKSTPQLPTSSTRSRNQNMTPISESPIQSKHFSRGNSHVHSSSHSQMDNTENISNHSRVQTNLPLLKSIENENSSSLPDEIEGDEEVSINDFSETVHIKEDEGEDSEENDRENFDEDAGELVDEDAVSEFQNEGSQFDESEQNGETIDDHGENGIEVVEMG